MKKTLGILAILANVFGGNTAPAAATAAVVEPSQPTNPNRVIPKGCKEFVFPDGFACVALNEKNAQKKWTKFLENKAQATACA